MGNDTKAVEKVTELKSIENKIIELNAELSGCINKLYAKKEYLFGVDDKLKVCEDSRVEPDSQLCKIIFGLNKTKDYITTLIELTKIFQEL